MSSRSLRTYWLSPFFERDGEGEVLLLRARAAVASAVGVGHSYAKCPFLQQRLHVVVVPRGDLGDRGELV